MIPSDKIGQIRLIFCIRTCRPLPVLSVGKETMNAKNEMSLPINIAQRAGQGMAIHDGWCLENAIAEAPDA